MLEHQAQLRLRDRQSLARADEEWHAGPAPVLDVEPERSVCLRRRAGGDPVDRQVAVVLAAHVIGRVRFLDRTEERDLRILDRRRVAA